MIPLRYIKKKILEFRKAFIIYLHFPELRVKNSRSEKDTICLKSAMEWLCLAQDATGTGGVSALYDLSERKWGNPYRETTGYIIATFINYSKISGDSNFIKRAIDMGCWLIKEQLPDGSFGEVSKNCPLKSPPINRKIFNTGQIILGLCSLYDLTREEKYLITAIKSSEWLIAMQENDGRWEKYTTQGAKTYHARVAWPLLEIYERTKIDKFKISAEKNLAWVLKQQTQNGWFKNCSLSEENKPWTHLIAYTIRGLLECSNLNKSKDMFNSAYKAAEKILEEYNKRATSSFNYLPGTFDEKWLSNDEYSCLTGNMQLAIIWLKLFKITKEKRFWLGAEKIIEQTKRTQILRSKHREVIGGIAGSFPISGDYASYSILNWATKFFADSLMFKIDQDISLSA